MARALDSKPGSESSTLSVLVAAVLLTTDPLTMQAHLSLATALVEVAGLAWTAHRTRGGVLLVIWRPAPLPVLISADEDLDGLESRLEKLLAHLAH